MFYEKPGGRTPVSVLVAEQATRIFYNIYTLPEEARTKVDWRQAGLFCVDGES